MTIPALKHFETEKLGKLLRLSRVRRYEDNEIIIREGDVDPWLYFLLSGSVRVMKDNVQIGTVEKMGDVFGEMRIVDDKSRSASVYASGQTVCIAVDTSAQNSLGSDQRGEYLIFLYKMFAEYMSIRLRLTSDELLATKKELEELKAKTGA